MVRWSEVKWSEVKWSGASGSRVGGGVVWNWGDIFLGSWIAVGGGSGVIVGGVLLERGRNVRVS